MRSVAVLGATGSIGRSTLDVLARHPDRFRVAALSAHRDVDGLKVLIELHRPAIAVLTETTGSEGFEAWCASRGVRAIVGPNGLDDVAGDAAFDVVVAGIVGAAGLSSCLTAAASGKTLLLANKEAVVMAGGLLKAALAAGNGRLVPLDSEHNAIFQCLPHVDGRIDVTGVDCLWLTASGGPFRGRKAADLAHITPDQACAHPKWTMGRKISVDSATLMNKGLEVIEAHHLFGLPPERIKVVVHPESTVHSLVAWRDGSLLAQLGAPDMRIPIAHALGFPDRIDSGVAPIDLLTLGQLRFEAPDLDTFRCLALAFAALKAGQGASIALNAANEVAVDAFLSHRIGFLDIASAVADVLDIIGSPPVTSLPDILALDAECRVLAETACTKRRRH